MDKTGSCPSWALLHHRQLTRRFMCPTTLLYHLLSQSLMAGALFLIGSSLLKPSSWKDLVFSLLVFSIRSLFLSLSLSYVNNSSSKETIKIDLTDVRELRWAPSMLGFSGAIEVYTNSPVAAALVISGLPDMPLIYQSLQGALQTIRKQNQLAGTPSVDL